MDQQQQQNNNQQSNNPHGGQLEERLKRQMKIQRCLNMLVHAHHCHRSDCDQRACANLKRVVAHARNCRRKISGSCRICREFIHLCCYHARRCQQHTCMVIFCHQIKFGIQQREQQQQQQQQQPPVVAAGWYIIYFATCITLNLPAPYIQDGKQQRFKTPEQTSKRVSHPLSNNHIFDNLIDNLTDNLTDNLIWHSEPVC